MKNKLIDAVKTAKEIHEGDYSSLRGKYLVIRDKIETGNGPRSGNNTVKKSNEGKMTLAKLAKIVVDGFNRIDTRIDNIETRIDKLEKYVKDINTRIDRIDTRLDYIVKANNLKDSK